MSNRIAKDISGRRLHGLPGGKGAARIWGNIWAARAAAALIEQARLELASAKRARCRKRFDNWEQLKASPSWVGSTPMVDPPRQFMLLLCVDESSVGHFGVPSGSQAPLIVVD